MDDNDFSKIISNFSEILNSGNIPDDLKNILNNFNSSNNNSSTTSEETTENSSAGTSSIDFDTILKMKSIFDKMNSSDDPRENLLLSLKPYLKNSRKSKLDQYIQFLKLAKVVDVFRANESEEQK